MAVTNKIVWKNRPIPKKDTLHVKRVIDLPDGFYKIVEGVAVPKKTRLSNIETKYSFLKTLGVSKAVAPDKVVGPCIQLKEAKIYQSVLNAAITYGKKNNKTFIGRQLENGFGVWRIK